MNVVKKFVIVTKDGSKVQLTFDINLTTREAELMRIDMERPLNKNELKAVEKIIEHIKEKVKEEGVRVYAGES